jgi:hypothetical protein
MNGLPGADISDSIVHSESGCHGTQAVAARGAMTVQRSQPIADARLDRAQESLTRSIIASRMHRMIAEL